MSHAPTRLHAVPALSSTPKERLARVEGIDLAIALHGLGGQMAPLVRVLRRFASIYRDGLPVLLQSSGSEHEVVAKWRLVCHSVRGALRAIGAQGAVDQVLDLERELHELSSRSSFIAKGRALHEEVAALAARLADALASTDMAPAPARVRVLDAPAAATPSGRRDAARLERLRKLFVLDTPPEPGFEAITQSLASRLRVPMAMVNILDGHRDWFKSRVGFERHEVSVENSFCDAFFDGPELVVVVEDTLKSRRYARHPFVAGLPFIRFYAAIRLLVDGHLVGTLCAFDRSPRTLSEDETAHLWTLAAEAMALLREPKILSFAA